MAKVNTNIMNDIAESLKDSTKNLSKEEKEKVENEVLQEVQQKIENQQKQINEATSKTSEELSDYANKTEETEKSIASSANNLETVNEIPKITTTIDLNARDEKIAIKREERKNNSTSSNTSKTSDTKVTEKSTTSSNTNTKTVETSKKTNDTKVVETNEIVDKSSTNNIKNTNITAKEKFKEQQLEEKNSKSNTNTTISQNLKNVEKRIDAIDTKNSNNINNSKTLTNLEISSRLGYIPGTELAIQEYSKATSKKIKEAKSVSNTNSSTNLEISSRLGYIPGTELAIQEYSKAASKKIKEAKSVSNTSSSTDEVPQQKSVREYLQAGPQWSYSDKSPINGYDVLTGVVSTTEEEPSFWHKLIYGTPESNKTLLENAEIIANDNDAIKEEYYNEHGYVTGGDLAVGAISIVEGVGIFAEDIVKVADIALSGAVTAFGALMALVSLPTNKNSWNEFKIFTEDIWDRTASRISKDHVSSVFDSFYNNTVTGQDIKQSSAHFDTARSFGVGVGYVGGAVLTGGAISSAAGIAGATASLASSGINGAVYGLARFGGSTGDAVQNGASMEEALLYGGLTGAKEGIGMFVGSVINSVNPVKGALPMTKGAWVNSATHVALDTLDGAVSATADPLIQTVVQSIYTPSEEKLSEMDYKGTAESYKNLSFGEKYKVNFEVNGGVNNVVGTALFSGVMSAGSEVIGQLKANSSVKKGQKLYNEVVENNTEINNIKGQSMLNDNNSLAYNTLDDLYAQRDSLKQAYDKLDDYGKYAFELSLTKDAINSGKIASADIDILLNSGKLKSLYQNLSNQERLALFDAMDETQMRSYFGQLGEKESKSFINKNSSYISDRFFNTDSNSTSSTWSNSTSLIESKTDLMVVKNTSNSVDSNNVDIIARNKFESRVGDIEADYNEAIDGIIDEYYTSLRPDVAVPKEKRAISVIQKKYGNNSDYEKAINLYYDELDDSAKKLSDSFLETYTTNYDSPTALTSSLLAKTSASKQQLAKKIEEFDSLIEEFKTKASYDIFGPHRTNVKVYSGLKEDFMDQYKKVESLESAIKATDKKYVDSVVEKGKELLGESDFEKLDRIFHPQKVEPVTEILEDSTIPRGKKLTTEIAKEKVGATNSTSATSKIGFQFFANKGRREHSLLADVHNVGKGSNPSGESYGEVDKFFMKTGTVYATDQHGLTDAIEDAMEYTGLVKLRDPNYEIDKDLLKKSCVEYELDLKNRGISDLTSKQIESKADDYVFKTLQSLSKSGECSKDSYLLEYFIKLNDGDYGKAFDQIDSVFEEVRIRNEDSEGIRMVNKLTNMGMPEYEARQLLEQIDSQGVCSYATRANQILATFMDDEAGFKECFGFDMYIDTSDGRQLNFNELLLDMYTWANSHYYGYYGSAASLDLNPKKLLKIDSDGNLRLNKFDADGNIDTEHQVYISGGSAEIFNEYLKTKGLKLKTSNIKEGAVEFVASPDKTFTGFVKAEMEKGNLLGLSLQPPEYISSMEKYYKSTGKNNIITKNSYKIIDMATGEVLKDTSIWKKYGHSMFITGTKGDEGVIVATWGHRALIKEEDFQGNLCSFERVNIERNKRFGSKILQIFKR